MSNSKSNRNDQGDQASGCCGGLFGTKTVAKGGESTENRDSDINGTGEVPAESDESQAQLTLNSAMKESMECAVCKSVCHQPVTVAPCFHSFCGGCLSKWCSEQSSAAKQCPTCREKMMTISRNSHLEHIITEFLRCHPSETRGAEELHELETRNIFLENFTDLRMQQRGNSASTSQSNRRRNLTRTTTGWSSPYPDTLENGFHMLDPRDYETDFISDQTSNRSTMTNYSSRPGSSSFDGYSSDEHWIPPPRHRHSYQYHQRLPGTNGNTLWHIMDTRRRGSGNVCLQMIQDPFPRHFWPNHLHGCRAHQGMCSRCGVVRRNSFVWQ
ncbi:uncharacterized protein LOC142350231 [Convolutriloba macropyga]|uniref:uncharacterized protein LOC142350231 n=1 Tax=Convolutriloba macropyga TaxID=536237 RepID=UPI003F51C96B